jgi:hypothetical protein
MPLQAVLEVLRDFALGLAGAVVLLSLLVFFERMVGNLVARRVARRGAEKAPKL